MYAYVCILRARSRSTLEYEHYTMHRVGKNKNKMLQINNFVWFRKVSLVPAKDVRQARGAAPR